MLPRGNMRNLSQLSIDLKWPADCEMPWSKLSLVTRCTVDLSMVCSCFSSSDIWDGLQHNPSTPVILSGGTRKSWIQIWWTPILKSTFSSWNFSSRNLKVQSPVKILENVDPFAGSLLGAAVVIMVCFSFFGSYLTWLAAQLAVLVC